MAFILPVSARATGHSAAHLNAKIIRVSVLRYKGWKIKPWPNHEGDERHPRNLAHSCTCPLDDDVQNLESDVTIDTTWDDVKVTRSASLSQNGEPPEQSSD